MRCSSPLLSASNPSRSRDMFSPGTPLARRSRCLARWRGPARRSVEDGARGVRLDRLHDQARALADLERLQEGFVGPLNVALIAQREGEAVQRVERRLRPADLQRELVRAPEGIL